MVKKSFPYPIKTTCSVTLLLMTIMAVIGFFTEKFYYSFIYPMDISHPGTSFGPWIQIYGFSTLAIFIIFWGVRKHKALTITISTMLAILIELVTGFVMDHFLHWRSWDYSVGPFSFCNYKGYISLMSSIGFVVLITLALYVIAPLLFKLEKIVGTDRMLVIAITVSGLFLLDVFYNDILAAIFGWKDAMYFYGIPKNLF